MLKLAFIGPGLYQVVNTRIFIEKQKDNDGQYWRAFVTAEEERFNFNYHTTKSSAIAEAGIWLDKLIRQAAV